MANEALSPHEIARILVRAYGDNASRRAEILVHQTFSYNTAETARILQEVLQAIDQIRSAWRN